MGNREFEPQNQSMLQRGIRTYEVTRDEKGYPCLLLTPDEDMLVRQGADFNDIKVAEINGNLWHYDKADDRTKVQEFLDDHAQTSPNTTLSNIPPA